jgi:hypothetical protein
VVGVGSGRVVCFYQNTNTGGTPSYRIGTISGTSISFGARVDFSSTVLSADGTGFAISCGNGKSVYAIPSTNANVALFLGFFDGTSWQFLSQSNQATEGGFATAGSVVYSSAADTLFTSYKTTTAALYSSYRPFGSTLRLVGTATLSTTNTPYASLGSAVSTSGTALFTIGINDGPGAVAVTTPTTSNFPGVIGIANASVSNGASVAVTTFGGTATNQTGLLTNALYYVGSSGLTTSPTTSSLLGKAVSATNMIIIGGNT